MRSFLEPIAAFLRLLCQELVGHVFGAGGTAYFGVRAEEPNYTIAMRALAEGHSLRGTGRIVDVPVKIPSVTGWTEPDGIVGPSPTCSTPAYH